MAQGIVGFQCIHFLSYRGWWNQGLCVRCTELPNIRFLQISCHTPSERSRPAGLLHSFWGSEFLESLHPHWQFLQCVIPKKKMRELSTELGYSGSGRQGAALGRVRDVLAPVWNLTEGDRHPWLTEHVYRSSPEPLYLLWSHSGAVLATHTAWTPVRSQQVDFWSILGLKN